MKRFWILKALKIMVFAAIFIFLGGYVIMNLWNWLIPSIFVEGITFGKAIGILILAKILFGGFGRRGWGRGCGYGYGGHQHWRQRMEERMAGMTPEQRDQFKQQMKDRWKNRCGNWYKEEEKKEEI
jgi:hypothetical protein